MFKLESSRFTRLDHIVGGGGGVENRDKGPPYYRLCLTKVKAILNAIVFFFIQTIKNNYIVSSICEITLIPRGWGVGGFHLKVMGCFVMESIFWGGGVGVGGMPYVYFIPKRSIQFHFLTTQCIVSVYLWLTLKT